MMTVKEVVLFKSSELVEFYGKVEALDFWDYVEPEEYAQYLDLVGLDYKNYDDAGFMWYDFTNILKEFNLI